MQQARRLLFVLGLVLGSLATGGMAPAASRPHPAPVTQKAAPAKPKPAPVAAAPIRLDTPLLLVDMISGNVLYESDAGTPWHPASLTKLMTAYVTFEAIAQGRISLDSRVTMSVKAVNEAPARSGLPAGDALSLQDALYVMLVKSANDVAVAIAETVGGSTDAFVAEMNATATRLGLSRTHFNNVNGLPDEGQVTTARDLAVLAIDLRRTFPQYDPIFRTHMVMLGKVSLRTNNEMLTRFAGTTGMKTGYVCGSGLNVVVTAERDGRQLLAVVLGSTSARERDQLAAQMLTRGFAGAFADSGKSVVNIVDDVASPPMDMKPYLCGPKAKAYVSQRLKDVPMGLRGQPSFLTDKVPPVIYAANDLGPVGGPAVAPDAIKPTDDAQPAAGDGTDGADTPAVQPAPRSPKRPPSK